MKLVLFALTLICCTYCHEISVYPYCRCCDDYSESLAIQNLIKWIESYQSCSPVRECVRNCLYRYNSTIQVKQFEQCSIDVDSMFEFYKWLLYNYQCLPYSLLCCVKKCATNFERYPSCYWTINSDIGIQTKK